MFPSGLREWLLMERSISTGAIEGAYDPVDDVVQRALKGLDTLIVGGNQAELGRCFISLAERGRGVALYLGSGIVSMDRLSRSMTQMGIDSAVLHSRLAKDELEAVESRFANGGLRALFVTPDKFVSPTFRRLGGGQAISIILADDANGLTHDLSSEGRSRKFASMRSAYPGVPVVAVSRKGDASGRRQTEEAMGMNEPEVRILGFGRSGLRYEMSVKADFHEQALAFMTAAGDGKGVVYCPDQKHAEELCIWMAQQNRRIEPLPSSATREERLAVMSGLRSGETDAVAVVSGDVPDMSDIPVGYVIHLHMPLSLDAYERDLQVVSVGSAQSLVLYGLGDLTAFVKSARSEFPEDSEREASLQSFRDMFSICDTISCRRQQIFRVLGGKLSSRCGNCDNCLRPPEVADMTDDSVLALNCIYRVPKSNLVLLVKTLQGEVVKKYADRKLEELKIFGKGSHLTARQWRSIYMQLYSAGYLHFDEGANLHLDESAWDIFRNAQTGLRVDLRVDPDGSLETNYEVRLSYRRLRLQGRALEAFDALIAARGVMADGLSTRPWFLFTDETVMEMARLLPRTIEEIAAIEGVAPMKAEIYGPRMLAALNDIARD